jgi:hypothetical protein
VSSAVAVQELFDGVAERMLAGDGIERARMMNAVGLRAARKFFALVVDGDLVVKLPAHRVDGLVSSGAGRPFESGRRVMKEWVRLRPADETACSAYAAEAHAYVRALAKA